MKDILNKIFGAAGGGVAEKLSGIVDKFVQTKEEKAAFEKEMTQLFMKHEADMEKNITDTWISAELRPELCRYRVTVLLN